MKDETKKTICLCNQCISVIRSRGERVFVGELVEPEREMICDWCDEESWELFECIFV